MKRQPTAGGQRKEEVPGGKARSQFKPLLKKKAAEKEEDKRFFKTKSNKEDRG